MGKTQAGKHMRIGGELLGDGAGKRVVKCEMCTATDKEGSGRERHYLSAPRPTGSAGNADSLPEATSRSVCKGHQVPV
jgi:hypothetical protein